MVHRIDPSLSIAHFDQLAEKKVHAGEAATLVTARQQLAEHHGFTSWRGVEVFLRQHSTAETGNRENHPPAFLRCACLRYSTDDGPECWLAAAEMLAAAPDLATRDIWHACAAGRPDAVAQFLRDDPNLVNSPGGFFGWEPLMYACYSRLPDRGDATLEAARILLEAGAKPNCYYMWGGQYRFTAVTGAFGEGENGPINSPPHPRVYDLARMLLDAGAEPNDAQALYNRMFTAGSECLEMLLEFGLAPEHRCNWLVDGEGGELLPNPQQTLQYQLCWAIPNRHLARARLLVEAGADLQREPDRTPFFKEAILVGDDELAELLVAHGAEKTPLTPIDHLANACSKHDPQTARHLAAENPELIAEFCRTYPNVLFAAVSAGELDTVRLLLDLGADANHRRGQTLLHQAAWNGRLEIVKLLIERGAAISPRDPAHLATPLQWAKHNHQSEVAEFLASQRIDIFDAISGDRRERVVEILNEDPRQLEITFGEHLDDDRSRDLDWMTPLAYAVRSNRGEIVQSLLQQGANPRVTNGEGVGLLELAVDNPSMLKLLEDNRD